MAGENSWLDCEPIDDSTDPVGLGVFAVRRGIQYGSPLLVDNANFFGALGGFEAILRHLTPSSVDNSADDDGVHGKRGEAEGGEAEPPSPLPPLRVAGIVALLQAVAALSAVMSRGFGLLGTQSHIVLPLRCLFVAAHHWARQNVCGTAPSSCLVPGSLVS